MQNASLVRTVDILQMLVVHTHARGSIAFASCLFITALYQRSLAKLSRD